MINIRQSKIDYLKLAEHVAKYSEYELDQWIKYKINRKSTKI